MPNIQRKVLIVDDDHLVRDVLAMHLNQEGFLPIAASSASEAWNILTGGEHFFVAAIVDRMMPGIDGTTLTKRIKANPAFTNLPVIMLTSAAERDEMIDAVQGGVFDFLLKPVEKELLMLVIQRAINISHGGCRQLFEARSISAYANYCRHRYTWNYQQSTYCEESSRAAARRYSALESTLTQELKNPEHHLCLFRHLILIPRWIPN